MELYAIVFMLATGQPANRPPACNLSQQDAARIAAEQMIYLNQMQVAMPPDKMPGRFNRVVYGVAKPQSQVPECATAGVTNQP